MKKIKLVLMLAITLLSVKGVNVAAYEINTVEDWDNYLMVAKTSTNAIVNVNDDLDFEDKLYSTHTDVAKGTIINGNGHTFSNLRINSILFRDSYAKISDLNFDTVTITGTDRLGIIAYNRGNIQNMNVKNIKVIGRDRIGVISENYNIINKLNVDNFEIKGRKYSAPIAKILCMFQHLI
ncbi:putative amino acid-binding ACT domain protein [Bacilli bacterium PM5-3]|nr:putative amino acid-binding ACT domain protein [Bacilli bacterium PM5-3]